MSDTAVIRPSGTKSEAAPLAANRALAPSRLNGRTVVMALYLLFMLLPIYWLVNMSFKTNTEITSGFSLWPQQPTLRNYAVIFTDPSWYSGYINSIIYVVLNTVISVTASNSCVRTMVASFVPAASASRMKSACRSWSSEGTVSR